MFHTASSIQVGISIWGFCYFLVFLASDVGGDSAGLEFFKLTADLRRHFAIEVAVRVLQGPLASVLAPIYKNVDGC